MGVTGDFTEYQFILAEQEGKKSKRQTKEIEVEKNYGVRFGRSKYESIMTSFI